MIASGMDTTFNTNVQDLLLTGVGPTGLLCNGDLPSMRWVPAACVLAHAEDTEAYALAIETYLGEHARRIASERPVKARVSDVWLDGSGGSARAVQETLPNCFVHRCLQHIKKNVRDESADVEDAALA